MDECKVIIMGFGSVGQGVANALSMKKELIKEKTGVNVKVVAAADSSTSAISQARTGDLEVMICEINFCLFSRSCHI